MARVQFEGRIYYKAFVDMVAKAQVHADHELPQRRATITSFDFAATFGIEKGHCIATELEQLSFIRGYSTIGDERRWTITNKCPLDRNSVTSQIKTIIF